MPSAAVAVNVTVSPSTGSAGLLAMLAVGARFSIVTDFCAVAAAPPSSVTCTRTVLAPSVANWTVLLAPAPSSKPSPSTSHANVGVPGSVSPDAAMNTRFWPRKPVAGPLTVGTGARLTIVTVCCDSAVPPSASVARTRTVLAPRVANVAFRVAPVPSSKPSPSTSHVVRAPGPDRRPRPWR